MIMKTSRIEEWDQLKPEGNRLELYRKFAQFKPESAVLVVGHEPYLSNMIAEIVFGNPSGGIALKKSGIAKVGLVTLQPKARGELKWLLTPKHLKQLAR